MKHIYRLEYGVYTTYNFQSIPYFSKLFSYFQSYFSPTLFSEVVTGEFWVTHSHWTQDEFRVGRLTDFWLELHVWAHPVAFFCLCSNRAVSVCSTQRWWVVTGVLYVFPSMDTQDGHSNPSNTPHQAMSSSEVDMSIYSKCSGDSCSAMLLGPST